MAPRLLNLPVLGSPERMVSVTAARSSSSRSFVDCDGGCGRRACGWPCACLDNDAIVGDMTEEKFAEKKFEFV
jgi:hypothetical protein